MGKPLVLLAFTLVTGHVMQTAATGLYYPGAVGIAGGAGLGGLGYAGYGGAVAGPALVGAGLAGAGLAGAGLYGGAGLAGAKIAGAGLYGAGLYGGAGLAGAGLYGPGLYGGAGLAGAKLAGAGLAGAGLYGAGLAGPGIYGAGLAGAKLAGAGLAGAGLYGAGIAGAGLVGAPLIHGYGGEIVDRNVFGGEKKILNDAVYKNAGGHSGGAINQGQTGFTNGVAAVKDSKGDHGYFNNAAAGKKIADDAKTYVGGQQFNQAGKQGGTFTEQQGHNKGHVIKKFKNSHHKDEAGNTEEYFDELNDEGGKANFNGQAGAFGANAASSLRGGHANDEFIEGGHKNLGHFDAEHLFDQNNAGAGKYGQNNFGGSGAAFGVNNGVGLNSLMGHHENSNVFKALPFY